jgi:signal transduction histidine kinase
MAYRSISLRLTAWFSSVFLAGLALFGAVMWLDLKDTLTSGRNRTLERRVDRLADLLHDTQTDPGYIRVRKFKAFAEATGGGLTEVFRIDGSRALPSPTTAAESFPWPRISAIQGDRFREVTHLGQPYRLLEHRDGDLVLCAAAPLDGNRTVLNAFSAGLLWAIPAVLAIAALGGYLLSRRALRPVDRITAATRSIGVSNLSERLPVPQSHDELQRLSETYNAMLARLEAAVTEIRRFTDDASHELRNPVSFVRTTAELALRNRQIDASSRRAFEEIVAECTKTSRLLTDMLTLARADADNSKLAFEAVDLADVVRTAGQRARSLALERGHMLTVRIAEGCSSTVWGDYASLHRLLWILLDNAAKYTPAPGDINVTLDSAGNRIALAVEDNGIGIAASDLPHIFERFYRADPARSEVEGSGLGLSIARWIADVHQAELSAESVAARGSIFRVVFPRLATPAPMRKEPAEKSLAG